MKTRIIKVEPEAIEYLESLYYDYNAKKDIINSIFELHQFDENDSILKSVPFKSYESKFAETKVKYDAIMTETQEKFIPIDDQEKGCRWEVDFEKNEIKIYPLQ